MLVVYWCIFSHISFVVLLEIGIGSLFAISVIVGHGFNRSSWVLREFFVGI